jgi:hypothetical protein
MLRNLALVCTILALAAYAHAQEFDAPSRAPPRAPDHPSQSHPVTTPAGEQIQITADNRALVEQNLAEQLDQIAERFASNRPRARGMDDVITALQPGGDHQFRVSLTGGAAYSFIAACDADCNDVDVELLRTADGRVVGSDLLTDDYPVVDFTPPADGAYYVRIILKTCTRAPCYVGARVLRAGST